MNYSVVALSDKRLSEAQQLARQLGCALIHQLDTTYDFLLVFSDQHLALYYSKQNYKPIYVDFLHGKTGYRARQGGGFKQHIARACGIRAKRIPSILDTTAGLANDAFILATLGCSVTLLERSKIMFALLKDGLERAMIFLPEVINRMQLIESNALDYLQQDFIPLYDVIYLDPMYSHRSQSTLMKKEMRVIREIVGEDNDAQTLLQLAKRCARSRVVVKRPRTAPPLDNVKPDIQFIGNSTRFDVYCIPKKACYSFFAFN